MTESDCYEVAVKLEFCRIVYQSLKQPIIAAKKKGLADLGFRVVLALLPRLSASKKVKKPKVFLGFRT